MLSDAAEDSSCLALRVQTSFRHDDWQRHRGPQRGEQRLHHGPGRPHPERGLPAGRPRQPLHHLEHPGPHQAPLGHHHPHPQPGLRGQLHHGPQRLVHRLPGKADLGVRRLHVQDHLLPVQHQHVCLHLPHHADEPTQDGGGGAAPPPLGQVQQEGGDQGDRGHVDAGDGVRHPLGCVPRREGGRRRQKGNQAGVRAQSHTGKAREYTSCAAVWFFSFCYFKLVPNRLTVVLTGH